jgi:uncharacterized protein
MHLHQAITTASVADPLGIIRSDTIGLQNLAADEKEGCRSCEWKYWCTGGCALATFRATGRYDIQSPNCSIYQALYPEAVRLEGLRLLKYHNEGGDWGGSLAFPNLLPTVLGVDRLAGYIA